MALATKKNIAVANWRPKNGSGDQKKISSSQLANEFFSQRRALSRDVKLYLINHDIGGKLSGLSRSLATFRWSAPRPLRRWDTHFVLPVDRQHGWCIIFDIVVESQSEKMEALNMIKYRIYTHFAWFRYV